MINNLIIVGGPISVGKSTLISSLHFSQVPEINENDRIQMLMLENTYNKGKVAPEVIEHYFLEVRKRKYMNYSQNSKTHILDRSIFESLWFSKENMNSQSFVYFKKLWTSEVQELISKFGKPKLYILLTMNWNTFKNRFFKRGRNVEIDNFQKNKEFFKKHINEYEKHMIKIFERFNINYVKISTDNLQIKKVVQASNEVIQEALNG